MVRVSEPARVQILQVGSKIVYPLCIEELEQVEILTVNREGARVPFESHSWAGDGPTSE